MKMHFVFILFFGLLLPFFVKASPMRCENILDNSKEAWVWKPADSIFLGLRSNVHHFWEWTKQNNNFLPQKLLKFQGWVLGDAHLFNFAEVRLKDGSLKWSFNDLDDSGIGPFIFDFIRFASTVVTSGYQKAEFAELYKAYVDAINGKDYSKPEIVKALKEISDKKMEEYWSEFIDKIVDINTEKIYYGSRCIVCFTDGPQEMQNFVNTNLHYFEAFLPQFSEITDIAFRTKETGGSQGLVRVFISAKVDGEFVIYEFKPLVRPGLDYYQDQMDQKNRINGIMKLLWKDSVPTDYRYIKIADREFFMRVRLPKIFEFHDEDEFLAMSNKEQKEYLLYIANWMGKKHRDQINDPNLYFIELDKESTQTALENFMDQYIQEASVLNTNANKP
jgi:hypothetical protein